MPLNNSHIRQSPAAKYSYLLLALLLCGLLLTGAVFSAEENADVAAAIDTMARAHEKIIENSVRIRFTAFALNSMTIKARIYVDTSDFSTYLSVIDDLNMEIMEIVQNAGAHFSQGAQTIMMESPTSENV